MLPYIDRESGNLKTESGPGTLITDVVSSSIMYIGKAACGASTSQAVWQILKLTTDTNGGITVSYANGNSLYNNIWVNRASLTYTP